VISQENLAVLAELTPVRFRAVISSQQRIYNEVLTENNDDMTECQIDTFMQLDSMR